MAYDLGIDLEDPNVLAGVPLPRVFKTHQRLTTLPRAAKYICVVRDPLKTAISWFNFLKAHQAPDATQHEDVSQFIIKQKNRVENLKEFDIFVFCYFEYFCFDSFNLILFFLYLVH